MNGQYGRILRIDVSQKKYWPETLDDSVYEKYLGGKGLASYILYKLNPPKVDPLDPANCLIFTTGPICGCRIWGSSRYGVFTKSPQTGLYSESYSGGKAPEAIDSVGYDAIVIQGQSQNPVVIGIHPEEVFFYAAEDLWGWETYNTEDEILQRYSRTENDFRKPGAVVIGPAAENLVRFGVIKNDHWRSAGRTGVGTIMGAKKIKGILFQGDRTRSLHDAGTIAELSKLTMTESKDNPGVQGYRNMGTSQLVKVTNNANAFPTRYWAEGRYEKWQNISAEGLHSRCDVKPRACAKCLMACGRMTTIKKGRHAGLNLEGPEYETIYAFGGLCMIDSIEEIAYLNDICDRIGIDTITAGNLCAFTIEAYRRGKVDYAIDYGQVDQIAELLHMIANRKGIGDVLAEGIKHAAKSWGLEDIAVHVKGMEPAGYDPRVLKGMGLAYATSDRGACHLRATFYKPELFGMIPPEQIEGKAELFLEFEDRLTIFDTLILCRFYRDLYLWENLENIVKALTGLDIDKDSLRQRAGAIATLIRRFNLREGMSAEDEWLSKGFFRKNKKTNDEITPDELRQMLKEYYLLHGWDENGMPPEEAVQ